MVDDTLKILLSDVREEADRLQLEGMEKEAAYGNAVNVALMKAVAVAEEEQVKFIEDHGFDEERWSRMITVMKERVKKLRPEMSEQRAAAIAAMIEAHDCYSIWEENDKRARRATLPQVAQTPARPGQIYFIQDVNGGPIKIGYSTNVKERIDSLNYPGTLRVLALIDGDMAYEKQLHTRFAAYRHKREWFEPADELLEFIGGLEAQKEG